MIKPIPGSYGYYADSNGSILSRKSCNGAGGLSKKYHKMKKQLSHDGYNLITLNLGGADINGKRQKTFKVSRLIARTFFKNFHDKCVVMHLDNNRLNDSVANLKIGTFSENHIQKIIENRQANGVKLSKKLTEEDVRKIKKLLLDGILKAHIAKKFGVSRTLIGYISEGKNWRYVVV